MNATASRRERAARRPPRGHVGRVNGKSDRLQIGKKIHPARLAEPEHFLNATFSPTFQTCQSPRMSRHWLALSARNSPAPFLYQTPTLSTSLLNRRAPSPFRSSYSSKSQSDEPAPVPTTDGENNAQQDSDVRLEKPRKTYLQRRAVSAARHPPVLSEPSETPSMTPRSFKKGGMTRSEKRVFNDLLKQIGGDQKAPEKASMDDPKKNLEDRRRVVQLNRNNEEDEISWIFNSVLKSVQNRNQNQEPESQSDAVTQIPEEPDADTVEHDSIERGIDVEYSNADISEELQSESIPMHNAISLIVEREAARTRTALQAAVDAGEGDQAVWDVCKERIFSMLHHLETIHNATADDAAPVSAPLSSDPSAASESTSTSTLTQLLDLPPEIPAEPVVNELYPKMLLSVFQLLNLHFPKSPLIGKFHTTVKSHGRASILLGASTGLYNEMIYFYWRGCQDLPSVLSLLQEMEVTGVEPDRRTCALLRSISTQRQADLLAHAKKQRVRDPRGPRSPREPWWDLAPNRKAVRDLIGDNGWISKLEKRAEEREKRAKIDTKWTKLMRRLQS
ncbi:uncharacterized protein KD926_011233 [Aspergillus affinis]|uniref:uncharacterized protein n=1 Tax=Aspergillus affinis TaxID=1070780 RepID=UPI0022FE7D5F|nr:uncharacterized protein KD926_011233 [Aspergillus affinis]KAI9038191.1 hypothetical protein KD926_011233 [Aspergillus affinis]